MAPGVASPEKREATVGETEPAQIWVHPDMDSLASSLAHYIWRASQESVAKHGSFTIAISGGSLVKALSKVPAAAGPSAPEWSKWHIFWADERVVPLDHADSNYAAAQAGFLSKLPVPREHIHAISNTDSAAEAATEYEATMKLLVEQGVLQADQGVPKLDLLLLGVGPDGHVASLFPGHALLQETTRWVAPILDSPKPPPARITLTLPVINAAARVGVVTTGPSKADILKRVFGGREESGALPAQEVLGKGRDLIWFMDTDAAASLLT